MPKVPPSSHILVTGASGFIAVWTCHELLEHGFTVRGTVRSHDKGEYLKRLFEKFGDKFSYVIVEDLEKAGGFDEAVKGMDGVAHLASPCHMNSTEDPYKDWIDPAVNGTLSLLRSAHKAGCVKRVVITSSYASVRGYKENDTDYVYSEKDWNEYSVDLVEKIGSKAPPDDCYKASKVLAEKAAWKYIEEEKPTFDLVTILPPFVFGPLLHQIKNEKALNFSTNLFYQFLIGQTQPDWTTETHMGSTVDVRDVALVHVRALMVEQAGGNRYAPASTTFTFQDFLDIVHGDETLRNDWPKAIKGTPGSGKNVKQAVYDSSKSKKDLGIVYRPIEATVKDMCKSLKERSQHW